MTSQKDKETDEDIYDFNFSLPSSGPEQNKSKPVKKQKPRIKPKTKAGNRMQALMQKSTMNIVSGSCSVLHNPDLFKVEKEAIEKSLKTPVREQSRIVPKVRQILYN